MYTLVDILKQSIIENINPSDLNKDIKLGLQIKENMIESITEDDLAANLSNYAQLQTLTQEQIKNIIDMLSKK